MPEALPDLLGDIKKYFGDNKTNVDTNGVPLSGSDLTEYDDNADGANSDATSAMQDSYYSGLSSPTELPFGGSGSTPYTDGLALFAAQIVTKHTADEDRQGQLDRLYTIQQHTDDAKDEVD